MSNTTIMIIYTIVMTHITMACSTIYLHRGLTHRAFVFHPALARFLRFWIWLTDGANVREWVAMHRKHHRFADKPGDPHSPRMHDSVKDMIRVTIASFISSTVERYKCFQEDGVVEAYTPDLAPDWLDTHLYNPYQRCGLLIMLTIDVLLFSWWGILIWIIQVLWTPFWTDFVITRVAHFVGYKDKASTDHSGNLFPIGIIIAGEEMHNNHHLEPGYGKFSRRWFEFDIAWLYANILAKLGLLQIVNRRVLATPILPE